MLTSIADQSHYNQIQETIGLTKIDSRNKENFLNQVSKIPTTHLLWSEISENWLNVITDNASGDLTFESPVLHSLKNHEAIHLFFPVNVIGTKSFYSIYMRAENDEEILIFDGYGNVNPEFEEYLTQP